MRWMLLQAAIVAAVLCSNAYWHWTPNNVLAAVLGGCAAWLVTAIITDMRDRRAVTRAIAEQRERRREARRLERQDSPADLHY
jgi:uncharacterized membrane protein YccC